MTELSPYPVRRPAPLSEEELRILTKPRVGEAEIHLWNYWRILRKRQWLILKIWGGTVFTVALILFAMTPIYTAQTTLLIERQVPQALNLREILTESLVQDEYDYYRTQYEILKSQNLAVRVILEQNLEEDAHFIKKPSEGRVRKLWTAIKEWGAGFVSDWEKKMVSTQAETPKSKSPLGISPEVIEGYQKRITIDPVSRTRLVKVAFSSPDPELSARVANAHAEAYIRQGIELRSQATEEAQHFLEGKLIELKARVEKSEADLNRYRQGKGIISLDDKENIVVDRLADLNKLLTGTEAERISLEAQVRLLHERSYDSLPIVTNNTLIQTLSGQLATLEGEYASLSAQFKPGFMRLDQLRAQVEEMRTRLNQEIQRVVRGIESAYLAVEAKEKELRVKMEEQKAAALSLKDASVEYAILSREVDTNRQLYENVLQRIKEIGISTEFRSSNISVIENAIPPLKPSKPQKTVNLLLASLLGLCSGVGIVFFLEYLDNTVKTPEEVTRYFLLPTLGVIPDFLLLDQQVPTPTALPLTTPLPPNAAISTRMLVLFHQPFSMVLEAYRTLRTAILLSQASEPPKTILFTSGEQREGKTVSVLNTAIVFAQMGVRVLVIDADLRHANCHKLLGKNNALGLTELLTGQRELDEVIQSTPTRNLFFLGSGSLPPDPTELLGSRTMQEILTALQEHYDYILIDSPPVMPVADAILLATMVDGVILVINSQKTPRHVVNETRTRLDYARAKILGVILNQVNMQNSDYAYHYGSSYSYNHSRGERGTK